MSLHKSFSICKRFLNTKPKRHKKFEWILPTGAKTNISVYNPVAKCKTPLILKNSNVVTWYMCGPTLYDSAHIGHACSYVRFDIIRRILREFYNINVVVVMGLTDIDDKIISRSKGTKQNWKKLTRHYEEEFFRDMASLNVSKPFLSCRVSDYIPEIIDFVKNIVDKNNAYVGNDGSVYFDTSNYNNYGKLSQPEYDDTPDENKKSNLDFALWKASKPDEPWWESPWGRGRPGWHIECSAMSSAIFGSNIDVHSGGIDLAFPHHENEEAQSCCYHNVDQWINYWIHSGHLKLTGDIKMSKSLFNTITIESFLKNYTANHFRLLCLLTHYRNGIEFSDEIMMKAVAVHKKINSFISNCNEYVAGNLKDGIIDESQLFTALNETEIEVSKALADDFHTPKAMNAIVQLISLCNKMFQESNNQTTSRSPAAVAAVANYVTSMTSLFGLSTQPKSEHAGDNLSKVIDTFVQFRKNVRDRALQDPKDIEMLKICDSARSNLFDCGIELKDRKEISTWNLIEK